MTFNEIILGTSPFIFAPQFGHRSRLYELDFEKQPENIAMILDKSYEMGVHSIFLNRSEDLEKALEISIANGNNWKIYAKTSVDNFEKDLEYFKKIDVDTVFLDGFFVDENVEKANFEEISKLLKIIKDSGFIPAIETRTPFKNVPIINSSSIVDDFETIMLPVNFYGYMMDINFLTNENKEKLNKLLTSIGKKIVANRTLATGILQPKEAYEFLGNLDNIDAVCVGVAKTEEAEDTFTIINEYKS